jgi:ketosteroid isomerase-like protein
MADDGDVEAIGTTLTRLAEGFARRDVSVLEGVYSEDADWTNAFGTTLKGSTAILEYLARLFADPRFGAGRLRGAPEFEIIPVSEDVVVARTYVEIEDQETVGGEAIPLRRNFSLKVLRREAAGRWPIIAEMYMDARDEVTMPPGDA